MAVWRIIKQILEELLLYFGTTQAVSVILVQKIHFMMCGFSLGLFNIHPTGDDLVERLPTYGRKLTQNGNQTTFLRLVFTVCVIWATSSLAHLKMTRIDSETYWQTSLTVILVLMISGFSLILNLVLLGALSHHAFAAPALVFAVLASMNFMRIARYRLLGPLRLQIIKGFLTGFAVGVTSRFLFDVGMLTGLLTMLKFMLQQGATIREKDEFGMAQLILYLIGLLSLHMYYSGLKAINSIDLRNTMKVIIPIVLLPLTLILFGCIRPHSWYFWLLHPLNISELLFISALRQLVKDGTNSVADRMRTKQLRHRGITVQFGTVEVAIKGAKTCSLCYEKEPNCVAMPCKHCTVCDDCVREMAQSNDLKRLNRCLVGGCNCDTIVLPPKPGIRSTLLRYFCQRKVKSRLPA